MINIRKLGTMKFFYYLLIKNNIMQAIKKDYKTPIN